MIEFAQYLLISTICISIIYLFYRILMLKGNNFQMMAKNEFKPMAKLKILALIPMTVLLFFGISCVNGQRTADNNTLAAVAPVKMNVLYIGIPNPLKIAVAGYETSDVTAKIDNGTISGSNGSYIVMPKRMGEATVSLVVDNKIINETKFRIKLVPDHKASVNNKFDGEITKEELLKAGEVSVYMQNFDFDLKFKVVSFNVTGTIDEFEEEVSSNSSKFTEKQIRFIKLVESGQKLYIENIKAVGPDGAIRKLGTLVFKLK